MLSTITLVVVCDLKNYLPGEVIPKKIWSRYMITTSQNQAPPRRLNPFAFPINTTIRFLLLISAKKLN